MSELEAIVLGLVQGLTEFLPVSSSGHLEIGRTLLGVEATQDMVFDVVVHAATVLSTIVVFRKEIWKLLKGFFRFKANDEMDYVLKIAVSMIPVFIVGVFFKDQLTSFFKDGGIMLVGGALILTAILLFFSDLVSRTKLKDKLNKQTPACNGISWWQAFVVGIGQAIAVLPGLSRSGTTISTGLICGVKREVIAQFSFLMVLVPILGEAFLEIVGGDIAGSTIGAGPLALGFISAFISGLFACKVMIALVKRARMSWFALYCLIVAILIFVLA